MNAGPQTIVARALASATPHDRIEDIPLPGGLNNNTCFACGRIFKGHPSRTACALCAGTSKDAR